jgi:glycosyltransferase involved in cell wall biosynthesis
MKIMIVTPYFHPEVGGLENYAVNIARGLHQKGHEVFVVTSKSAPELSADSGLDGIRIKRLPIAFKMSNTPMNLFWYYMLKKIIKVEKPDIINAHSPVSYIADMAARAAGQIPFVLTYHNDLTKTGLIAGTLSKVYYRMFSRRTMRRSNQIIATSSHYIESSPYLRKYRDKISVVPPGVDLGVYNESVDSRWLKDQYPDKRIVLFVGSLNKTHAHKGIGTLLKAVKQVQKTIPNVQLIVVGKGDAIPTYQREAKDLGIEGAVSFTGFASNQDLPKYYAGADIFVLPSTTDAEGFGMVILEAAACGTPSIGSDIGGIPIAIEAGQTGDLSVPGSTESLASKLRDVLSHPEKLDRYGKAAALRASTKYSWQVQHQETENILKHVAKPKVCIIHNVISPYRLGLFESLSHDTDLTVLFCKPITKDRAWHYDLDNYTFHYQILKGVSIGPVIINTNAISALLKSQFDVVIFVPDPDTAPIALTAILLAKLRRRKIVLWSEVIDENIHFFPSLAYGTSLAKKSLRKILSQIVMSYRTICFVSADHFIAFSDHAKDFLTRHHVSAASISRTFEVMPLDQLARPTSHSSRTGKTFLYLGYLIVRKDVKTLIDAFMQIPDPDARLVIAGLGPLESNLKELAAGDKRIEFVGYIEGQDKANLYASSDVFVLPTLSDCWGLVINEAMHYGLAVICSSAAAAIEIVDSKVGLVVTPGDTLELKAAMEVMLADPKTLKKIQNHNTKVKVITDTNAAAKGFTQGIDLALLS